MFGDLLGLDRVSTTRSFFEMGGNSLMAAQLSSRIVDALGTQIGIRDLFEAQTVRELASLIGARRDGSSEAAVAVPQQPEWRPAPALPWPRPRCLPPK